MPAMGSVFESRATRNLGLIVSGVGLAVGAQMLANNVSHTDFTDELAKHVDKVAAGKPFNTADANDPTSGLRVEVLAHPNPAAIDAALYNAFENAGATDPANPNPRIRAAATCGTLALNSKPGVKGALPSEVIVDWRRAQDAYAHGAPSGATIADQFYTAAATACGNSLAAQTQPLLIPVAAANS